jgi:dipeptidyl aminopeptidase/acylaminoacyl peptidase
VTLPPEEGEIACPEWSRDGAHIAVRAESELWVVDAVSGSTTVVPVTQAPFGQQGFEWSRDGSRIAVAEPRHIRVVRVDGGASTLIPVEGFTPGSLGWTAVDEIVHTTTDEPGDALTINVVASNGTNDTRITPDATAGAQLRFDYAVVSPRGTRVAYLQRTFRCSADGCSQDPERVFVTDTHGLSLVEVPIPAGFGVSGLQWSPDGERLLLGSIVGVVSVGLAPGSPDIVYSRDELNLEWSPWELSWQAVYE